MTITISRERLVSFVLDAVLITGILAVGVWIGRRAPDAPSPAPAAYDKALVPIGRAYAGVVLSTYATAWNQAADAVASGKPVSDSLAALRTAWEAERTKQYQAAVSPAFWAIVPENATEESITPTQRAALAAAFRGFAKGVGP